MARHGQLAHATLIGFVLLCGVALGLLSAFGLLQAPLDAVPLRQTSLYALRGERRWFAPIYTLPLAAAAVVLVPSLAGTAALPYAIIAALLVLLLSALRRPALLVFVIVSALYLPWLGAFGLWDPWETHYGEVAREIMSRDDWISLWQAHDRWFWSKPILIFWAEALSWSASGVGFQADSHPAHTEWVLRLPIYLMALTGLLALYFAIARVWNRRAGVLAAVVLATTPYYAFLSRQAVTDMPFVASMTVAMMMLVLACAEDPERRTRTLRVAGIGLSLQHLVFALIVLLGLPQLLYLASRNITWLPPFTFSVHRDAFLFGSPGNSGVPGNPDNEIEHAAVAAAWCQPFVQALIFGAALAVILWRVAREKRAQALYMYVFYVFCALAFMAKGIPGFALPGLVALCYLVAARRFDLLFDGRLRVGLGVLIVCVLGLPWFVAMHVRHGSGFIERILIHDHINRLTSGVHGDNGSIQYFIWQLGYGMFPWVALIPVALMAWFASTRDEGPRERVQQETLQLLGLWFAVTFTLFSVMTTKFHHYILPAVPPLAAMIGVLLERLLPARLFSRPRAALRTFAAVLAPLCLVFGFAGMRGDVRGIIPEGVPNAQSSLWVLAHPWALWKCLVLVAAGAVLFALALWREQHTSAGSKLGPGLICGAIICAFVGRDLSWHTGTQPPGSERLIHLFVYNYTRPWPEYLDYRAILFGFAAVAALLSAACAVARARAAAASGLLSLSLLFCVFCVDVYTIDLTPHWTQQGLIDRYYGERHSADEPLLAYQMNWKGENYYTGNRVHMFESLDTEALGEWIGNNKSRRVYFILEHSRVDRLKKVLGTRELELLTNKRDCNKFLLARATM